MSEGCAPGCTYDHHGFHVVDCGVMRALKRAGCKSCAEKDTQISALHASLEREKADNKNLRNWIKAVTTEMVQVADGRFVEMPPSARDVVKLWADQLSALIRSKDGEQ
jgi:hypothetical protein